MLDERGDAAWTDPSRPPDWGADLTRISDQVWSVTLNDALHLWHWCTESLWVAEGRRHAGPKWALAGVRLHQIVATDPLHLEPSVYWSDCCGMHGWVRGGEWTAA